ncbi:unnamed protein product [Oikopleura dioica]|uniref:Uncharacterized protein n=1 Tax=Oikopleura dioica TaxID=34765 RepID=E4YJH0_OIKDI|nr:unnamed protein product [Oikopleura dioica]
MQNLSHLSFGTDCYGAAVVIGKLAERLTTDVDRKERWKAILSKMKNGRISLTAGIAEVRVILKSIESLPNSFESLEDEIKEDNEFKTTDSSFEIVSDLLTERTILARSSRRLREVSNALNEMNSLQSVPPSTSLDGLLRSRPNVDRVDKIIKKANEKNALPRWFHFLLQYGIVQAKSSFNVVVSELEVSISVEKDHFKNEELLVKCVRCVKRPDPCCEFCKQGKIVRKKTKTKQKQETQSRKLKKILGSPTGMDQKLLNRLTQAAGSQVKCKWHKPDTKECEFETEVKEVFSEELEKLETGSTNISLNSSVIVIPVYELTMSNTVDRASFLICGSNYEIKLKDRRKLTPAVSRKSSLISSFPLLSCNFKFPLKAKTNQRKPI